MTEKQKTLVNELLNPLIGDEKEVYSKIVYYLIELGYFPQKQRSYLSFKSKNGKIIAKIRNDSIRIKFFACKNVPNKYMDALRYEFESNDCKNGMPVPPPDTNPLPENVIMKRCTLLCSVCTGGGMRYYYRYPDDKEIFRCGAYPVLIPNVKKSDIVDMKKVLLEQHEYFLSIS